jgi:transposase
MDSVIYGIDVSKEHLDFCSENSQVSGRLKNSLSSILKLIKKLKDEDVKLVVVEATGGYERLLVAQFWAAKIPVAVVNPRQTWAFGKSLGCEAKTDKIDARTLALFGAKMNPRPTAPLAPELLDLQEIQGRRAQLMETLIAEKNHLQAPLVSSNTKGSLTRSINYLKKEIRLLDEKMREIVQRSPSLNEKV